MALAAALAAERCDIFTDVEGVFTCDPRIVAKAHKLDKIAYEEMLEMASLGAEVLHARAVATAMTHGVRLHVLSAFSEAPGTLIVDESEIVEKQIVSGIAYSRTTPRSPSRICPTAPVSPRPCSVRWRRPGSMST